MFIHSETSRRFACSPHRVTLLATLVLAGCASAHDSASNQDEGTQIIDGQLVYEDIILDANFSRSMTAGTLKPQAASFVDQSRGLAPVWPAMTVTLAWGAGTNPESQAAQWLEAAAIQWTTDTGIHFNWVANNSTVPHINVLTDDPTGCRSTVGYPGIGNNGFTEIAGCSSQLALEHELGHGIGYIHEQSRFDRNQYVTIAPGCAGNAGASDCQLDPTSVGEGLYDYSSIMEYASPAVTTKSGGIITAATEISRYDILGVGIMYAAEQEKTTTTIATGGVTHVFVRGPDGQLWWGVQNSGWTGFSSIGAPNQLPTLGMPAVVSRAPNQIDLFVRGIDSVIYRAFYNGASWTGWTAVGGVASSDPSAVSWGGNRLDVFFRGADSWTDGKAWHMYSNNAGNTWSNEPINVGPNTILGTPQVISRASGTIDLIALGPDTTVYWLPYQQAAGGWAGSVNLGGQVLGTPKLVSWSSTRFDIFVQGVDRGLWHKWYTNSGFGSSTWENLGGSMNGNPEVVSWGNNRLDVFYQGSDGAGHHKAWLGSSWYPSSTTDESLGGLLIGTPSVTTYGPNTLNIYVRGRDNVEHGKLWTSSGWNPSQTGGWPSLGGSIVW